MSLSFAESCETDQKTGKPSAGRASEASEKGRTTLPYNLKTLLLLRQFSHILQSLKMATAADEEWVKANEKDRPIHISVMQDKQACPVCFKSKYVKLFATSGLQQHFRTMHKERFSDDIIKQAKQLTEKLHGDETKYFLERFSSFRREKVSPHLFARQWN